MLMVMPPTWPSIATEASTWGVAEAAITLKSVYLTAPYVKITSTM